jgi:hypothetical protein
MTASPTRATDGPRPPEGGAGTRHGILPDMHAAGPAPGSLSTTADMAITKTQRRPAGGDGGLTPVTGVARRQTPPRRSRLGRALTAGLIIFGAALFVAGRLGAATGWMYTSFDPHHVISQIGGAALFLAGLMRLR